MAITKDQEFKIKISVEDNATAGYESLEGKSVDVVEISEELQKQVEAVTVALEANNAQLKGANSTYSEAMKTAGKYNKILLNQEKAVTSVSQATVQQVKVVKSVGDAFIGIGSAVEGITSSVSNVLNIIKMISDPKSISNLSKMLRILSLILRVKGQKEFSDTIFDASENLQDLSVKMEAIRSKEGGLFQALYEKAESANSILRALDTTFAVLKTSILGIIGLNVAAIFSPRLRTNLLDVGISVSNVSKDITSFSGVVHKSFTPGIFGLIEKSRIAAPALLGLSLALRETESEALKTIGTLSAIASLLIGSFTAASVYALSVIGEFIEAIGDKLIGAMTIFEEKAAKFEASLFNLKFSIEGISREVGETAVNSFAMWSSIIEETDNKVSSSTDSLVKSVNLISNEAVALGLKPVDQIKIFEAALDVAASRGKDMLSVTTALVKGLGTTTEPAFNLGIALQDSALAHSKYVHESGKSIDSMNDQEKQLAKLSVIYENHNRVLNAAEKQTENIAGANALLTKRIEVLQRTLGEQGNVTRALIVAQTNLVNAVIALPKVFTQAAGALIDFLGVFLKLSGVTLSYILLIAGLTTVYKILTTVIAENATVQLMLSKAMAFTSASLGVQTAQVTSLSIAMSNLAIITKGALAAAFKSMTHAVLSAGKAILVLGKALLTNPVVLAVGLIIGAVYLIIEAFGELRKELSFIDEAFINLGKMFATSKDELTIFDKAWEGTKEILQSVMKVLVNFTKLIITGLMSSMLLASKAVIGFKLAFADAGEETEALKMQMAEIDRRIKVLGGSVGDSIAEIGSAFDTSAIAAEKAGEEYEKAIRLADTFRTYNAQLTAEIDKQTISIGVWGTAYEKAASEVDVLSVAAGNAMSKYRNLKEEGKASGDEIKKAWADAVKATKELAIAHEQMKKIRADAILDMIAKTQDLKVSELKSSKELVKAAELELKLKLDAFDKEAKALRKVFKLKKEELKIIDDMRSAIEKEGAARIAAAQEQEIKDAQEQAGKGAILFDQSQIQTIESALGGTAADFASGMASATSGVLGAVAALNMIVQALQSLIDLIPNLIDAITGLFTSQTDLPARISDALKNLAKGITDFVSDFIPNLIDSIGDIMMTVLDFFIEGLPKAFEKLMEKIPEALLGLIERLPEIAFKFGQALVMFFTRGAKFVVIFATAFIKAAPKLITALIRAMPEIAMGLVDGIIFAGKELVNMIANLFGMGDIFNIDMGNVQENIEQIGDSIARSASKLFEVIDLTAEMRGLTMSDRIHDAIKSAMWDVLAWLQNLWKKFVKWLSSVGKAIWEGLKQAIIDAWEFIKEMGKTIWEGLKAAVQQAWNFIKEIGSTIWEGLKNIASQASAFLENLGKDIWEGVKKGFSSALNFFQDIGRNIWEGFWNNFKQLGSFITRIFDSLNPKNFFLKMFDDSGAWGTSTVENALGIDVPFISFAQGGIVPGSAVTRGDSNLNDRVLALVSPGEAIIPRSDMENPRIANMIGQVLDGKIPSFSIGGDVIDFVTGGGDGGFGLPDLGDIGNISIDNFTSSMSAAWEGLKSEAKAGWKTLINDANMFIKFLNPEYLWRQVYGNTMKGIWRMIEANKFATGGYVADYGLAEPGEFVMKRSAVDSIGVNTLNDMNNGMSQRAGTGGGITIQKIEINARTDLSPASVRSEILPEIVKGIKRMSQDGSYVLSAKGVR